MKFQAAVELCHELRSAYHPGLQALSAIDRRRIDCRQPNRLAGSVNLESALKADRPNDARWDYGIGLLRGGPADHVIWVEVHPASSLHVREMLRKHDWLRKWLKTAAPSLDTLDRRFVWIASGAVSMPPHSPQRRAVASKGIEFVGRRLRL